MLTFAGCDRRGTRRLRDLRHLPLSLEAMPAPDHNGACRRPVWSGRARNGALLAGLAVIWATGACAADYHSPSGKRVPRWVSLKYDRANARVRPDRHARILWILTGRDLPVQVTAEHQGWFRVCDPEGGQSWVWSGNLSERRHVQNRAGAPQPLRRTPDDRAAATAALSPTALARLKVCRQGWCQIDAGRWTGWVPLGTLWGTLDYRQCFGGAGPPASLSDFAPHAPPRRGGPRA